MWIYTKDSFLSIVQVEGDADHLLVRARMRGDIENWFPAAVVRFTPSADYYYRAAVRREEVANTMLAAVMDVDYPNFKNSVDNRDRHDAYLDCWYAMKRWQERKLQRRMNMPRKTAPKRATAT